MEKEFITTPTAMKKDLSSSPPPWKRIYRHLHRYEKESLRRIRLSGGEFFELFGCQDSVFLRKAHVVQLTRGQLHGICQLRTCYFFHSLNSFNYINMQGANYIM